jgi:hypothetical protein
MVNTQSQIVAVNEANINGVRALDSKGLIEMQEQGTQIIVKRTSTVTMNGSQFRLRKLELNKTRP